MGTANGSITPDEAPKVSLQLHKTHQVCLVLDYGSQYTQLIARRVREQNVYSMLLPGDVTLVSYHVQSLHIDIYTTRLEYSRSK